METPDYKNLILNAPFGYAYHKIILDETGKPIDFIFLEVNSAFEKLTGLKASQVIQKKVSVILPVSLNRIFNWIEFFGRIAIEGGEEFFEQFSEPLNRWYRVQAYSTEKYYFATTFLDITEIKRMEKEHVKVKERYELAIKGSNDGIWDWNLKTNELYISTRYKEQLGYEDSELLSEFSTFESRLHPLDRPIVLKEVEKYLSGKAKHYDVTFRFKHKLGHYIWIRSRGEAIQDEAGVPYRMAGSHTDITYKKMANDLMRISEAKYRLLTEFTSDVIWVLNLRQQKFTYISPSIYQLRGLTVEEAMLETMEDSLLPGSLEIIKEAISKNMVEFIENPEEPKSYINEVQQPHKNGNSIWIEVSTKYRYNEEGEIEVVGASRNIENRKKLEKELLEAKERAEQANKAKSDFLANMSHEIRTPLNGVSGFLELLSETNLSEEQTELLNNANTSAKNLLEIINDILDFSKIEAGRLDLENIEVNLPELIYQTIEILRYSAVKKGIQLSVYIPKDLPAYVLIDPVRIKQVWINLISNAIKFTQDGEVQFILTFSPHSENTDCIELSFAIQDTGIGITEKQREKLFQAFSQADTSTTRKFGGTGLGLVISNSIVEKMGGKLDLVSNIGVGTTFFFTITVPTAQKNLKKQSKKSLNRKEEYEFEDSYTILIAEDVPINMDLIKRLVKKIINNVVIIEAKDGNEAVAKTIKNKPDLILMDIQMPYKDGYGATKEIREYEKRNGNNGSIPILALTAGAVKGERENCLSIGMDDFLTKPINKSALQTALKKFLKKNKKK